MAHFGEKSTRVLDTLHPALQLLMTEVVKHHDITLLEGHRAEDRQNQLFNEDATEVQWPDSRHNQTPSMAVDAAPWPIPEAWGFLGDLAGEARELAWKERVKFYQTAAIIKYEWARLQQISATLEKGGQLPLETLQTAPNRYRLRLGADWDNDNDYRDQTFDDLVHIEIWEIAQEGAAA